MSSARTDPPAEVPTPPLPAPPWLPCSKETKSLKKNHIPSCRVLWDLKHTKAQVWIATHGCSRSLELVFDDGSSMSLALKPSWRLSGNHKKDGQESAKRVVFALLEKDTLLVYEHSTAYFCDLGTNRLSWSFDKYISVSAWGVVTNAGASTVWFTEDSNTVTIKHCNPNKRLVRLDMDLLSLRRDVPDQVTQCALVRAQDASHIVVRAASTNKVASDHGGDANASNSNWTGGSSHRFEKCLVLTKYNKANQATHQRILYIRYHTCIRVEDLTLLDDTASLVFAITLDGQKDVVQLDAETLAWQAVL